jgi:hypothetical protein
MVGVTVGVGVWVGEIEGVGVRGDKPKDWAGRLQPTNTNIVSIKTIIFFV